MYDTSSAKMYKAGPLDVAAAIAVFMLFLTPVLPAFVNKDPGNSALVTKDNVKAASLDLKKDGIYRVATMDIEVKSGRVRVLKSDCPRKVCSHAGWISKPGQSLVCLPNRTIIEIPAAGNSGYDAVSR